jgi:hypothetical protein
MLKEPKHIPWLHFVDKAPDDGPLLRLMVLNPINNELSTFSNQVVDTDPEGYAIRPSDLHTFAHPEAPRS